MRRIAVGLMVAVALAALAAVAQSDDDGAPDAYDQIAGAGGMYESHFTNDRNGCAACCTYAAALRRATWDNLPVGGGLDATDAEGREARRKALLNDDRVTDISMEAMLGVIQHYVYVPKYERYAPLEAAIRAKSLTEAQRELAERQRTFGGDQGLMAFIHGDIMVDEGDALEKYAGRDLMKGHTDADFLRASGSGACDVEMSNECAQRMVSFRILKDPRADVGERTAVATHLCKRYCGSNTIRAMLPMEAEDLGVEALATIHRVQEEERAKAEEAEALELELLRVRREEAAEEERRATDEGAEPEAPPETMDDALVEHDATYTGPDDHQAGAEEEAIEVPVIPADEDHLQDAPLGSVSDAAHDDGF